MERSANINSALVDCFRGLRSAQMLIALFLHQNVEVFEISSPGRGLAENEVRHGKDKNY